MKKIIVPLIINIAVATTGCGYDKLEIQSGADAQGHSAPTQVTIDANKRVLGELPFENMEDFEQANRGIPGTRMPTSLLKGMPQVRLTLACGVKPNLITFTACLR